jgi:hypothetical protein
MTSNKITSNETEKNKICEQSLVLSTSILHWVSLRSIRQFELFYTQMYRVTKLIHDYLSSCFLKN